MTKEIKTQLFAQYIGQKVLCMNQPFKKGAYLGGWYFDEKNYDLKDAKLLLKSLENISDIDAINIAKIFFKTMGCEENSDTWFLNEGKELCNSLDIRIHQYLQSNGYDLPQYHLLEGKTLKEAGLAIYE